VALIRNFQTVSERVFSEVHRRDLRPGCSPAEPSNDNQYKDHSFGGCARHLKIDMLASVS
jgi:hypothetical protein